MTQYSPAGGCACKSPRAVLGAALGSLQGTVQNSLGNLLLGVEEADDGAVYQFPDRQPVILTCDVITPVVDDPYTWGRIAAENAMSDVYAMGGQPQVALNLLAWPDGLLESDLTEVLMGGPDAVNEAGAVLAGGHTITDDAPKYGLFVAGTVNQRSILRKSTGNPGDVLVLTKPLGVGVASTALKMGTSREQAIGAAIDLMKQSNSSTAKMHLHLGFDAPPMLRNID